MRSKIVTADEAVALIRDGDTLASTGFVQTGFAEALLSALERRFLATGSPKGLTLFAGAGQGSGRPSGSRSTFTVISRAPTVSSCRPRLSPARPRVSP